ncbi:hydroxymethylbilane synthase [Haloarchaeobius amylolyticus]|uniref:hydroxymethylbilane synthase n=1 Tax=Haloarchaeobius amylolyticus TaxID=1198296 RepID=UPI00226D5392|nr:hydroxymethylbilane synthase [Haloarchaeobius amylolyticus]
MRTRGTIRLATRGSDLALRQAATVRETLEDQRYEVELVEVETEGDRIRDELIQDLGKTGAFVRSLDEEILDGNVDAAVHSMKDMPTEMPDELVVAGVPERAAAGDVLVTPAGTSLDDLEPGAVVGTSSMRRQAQIENYRDDLVVEPLRGNVDTRVEKLLAPALQREHERRNEADKERKGNVGDEDFEPEFDRTVDEWFESLSEIRKRALGREVETDYDAIVLAEAGLRRAGLLHHIEYEQLPTAEFVPAAGQGALAITARDGETAETIFKALDHPRTRVETTVERTVLAGLNGGCVAPIGVHAMIQGEYVRTTAQILHPDGDGVVQERRDLPVETHADAAREFAADLNEAGAAEYVEAARQR